MRIGKKIFPYPVLNRDKSYSTVDNVTFKINDDYVIENSDEFLIISNIYYCLDDNEIKNLIKEGFIEVYLVVESSSSFYKKKFLLTEKPGEPIKIAIDNLKDRVEFSAYGIVKKDITTYNLANFNEFYDGYNFKLSKNNILLIDDGFSSNIEFDENKDDVISSIFLFVKVNTDDEVVGISNGKRKISIFIPEEQFNIYEMTKIHNEFSHIYFAAFLIPALMHCLSEIKQKIMENDFFEDLASISSEFYWFDSIIKQYKNVFEKDLTLDEFENINLFELSQKLINNPITKSVDDINRIIKVGEKEDEDTY